MKYNADSTVDLQSPSLQTQEYFTFYPFGENFITDFFETHTDAIIEYASGLRSRRIDRIADSNDQDVK